MPRPCWVESTVLHRVVGKQRDYPILLDPVRIEQHRGSRRQFIVHPVRAETADQHGLVVGIGCAQAQVAVLRFQVIDPRHQVDFAPLQSTQRIGLTGIAFDAYTYAQGSRQPVEVVG